MSRYFQWFVVVTGAAMPLVFDAAVKGALLLVLAGLCVLSLRRASAATRHLVWLVAVVTLLLVPVLSVLLPRWRVLPQWAAAEVVLPATAGAMKELPRHTVTDEANRTEKVERTDARSAVRAAAAPMPDAAGKATRLPIMTERPAVAVELPQPDNKGWKGWLPLLWGIGCALCALRLVAAYWLLRRATADCVEVRTGHLQMMMEDACAQLGVRQRVRLLMDSRRTIPVVWGVFRPRLVLPVEAEEWETRQVKSVLLHELAHVRRRDTAVQWITQIACALHWFNPLVWLAAWRLHAERERACDDLVLASGVRASDYAEHLLHVATKLQGSHWASACGLAMARPSQLEGRLLAVLSDRLNRSRVTAALAAAVLVLGACVAIPLAMLRAEEEAWRPPQAAHISLHEASVYCVHDGERAAFILYYAGLAGSATESSHHPKLRTWTDSGRVTPDGSGKTFAFFRDHTAPDALTLNGTLYDLTKGRVFVLGSDGSIQQLPIEAPVITNGAALQKFEARVAVAMPGKTLSLAGLSSEDLEARIDALKEKMRELNAKLDAGRKRLEILTARGKNEEAKSVAAEVEDQQQQKAKMQQQLAELNHARAKVSPMPLSYTVAPDAGHKTILPGESLNIFVKEDPTYSGRYEVDHEGRIRLMLAGSVTVAGKEYEEAQRVIVDALKAEFPSRNFTVWIEPKAEESTEKETGNRISTPENSGSDVRPAKELRLDVPPPKSDGDLGWQPSPKEGLTGAKTAIAGGAPSGQLAGWVMDSVGKIEIRPGVTLEVPEPEPGQPTMGIVRWAARNDRPALRHEFAILSGGNWKTEKWAIGVHLTENQLWVVTEEKGSAPMLRQIAFNEPAKIFENFLGRREHEPIRGLDIPEPLAELLERKFTIQKPPPGTVEIPGGPIMGGQKEHAAKTEEQWIVEGYVTDANDKPLAGVEVEAHCEHYPLLVLDRDKTDAFGHYRLNFRLGMETLAAFRGITIQPKLTGFAEAQLGKSGEFNAVLHAGEKVEHPFASRDLVIGEQGRADFVMRQGCMLTGQMVDAEGHPLARRFIAARTPGQRQGYSIASTATDGEGHFQLENIPAGSPVFLHTAAPEKPYQNGSSEPASYEAGLIHRLKVQVKQEDLTRETMTVEKLESSALPPKEAKEKTGGLPVGIPDTYRGLDLQKLPRTRDEHTLTDLWHREAGEWKNAAGIFEMPLQDREKAWLRYVPSGMVFYLEMRDASGAGLTFGPIKGDPFLVLGLRDEMLGRMGKWETAGDLEHRAVRLLRNPATMRFGAELLEAIHPPISLHEFDDYIAELEKARQKARDAETQAAVKRALTQLKDLAADREARRAKLGDNAYSKVGERVGNLAEKIVAWGPEQDGLRLGLSLSAGKSWPSGSEVEMEVWVCNASDKPIRFQSTPRQDVGLRMWLKGRDGKEREAQITMNTIPVFGDHLLLEPGKVYSAKKFAMEIAAPRKEKEEPKAGWAPRFEVAPGTYQFVCELSLPGFERGGATGEVSTPAAGEWFGRLQTAELGIAVVAR